MTQECRGYGSTAPHTADGSAFAAGKTRCKTCTAAYFADWKSKKQSGAPTRTYSRRVAPAADNRKTAAPAIELVEEIATATAAPAVEIAPYVQSDPITANGHAYRADPELVSLFDAAVKATASGHPITIAMHGPSGSGKTDGAKYLAARIDRPFVKIDCKSMIDAEAWFGTRGATGGSTFYSPSAFVTAIQGPNVILLDEYNRVTNDVRDVLNPILDGTRAVTNPITGETIKLHPDCVVILAGNVGFRFTGTFDVDPALTSRVVVHNVDYPEADLERAILRESAGVSEETADRFVRFALETRANSKIASVSTRELLAAAHLVRFGQSETQAIRAAVIAGSSDDGGATSARAKMDTLWNGYASGSNVAAEEATPANCTFCYAQNQTAGQPCSNCSNVVAA